MAVRGVRFRGSRKGSARFRACLHQIQDVCVSVVGGVVLYVTAQTTSQMAPAAALVSMMATCDGPSRMHAHPAAPRQTRPQAADAAPHAHSHGRMAAVAPLPTGTQSDAAQGNLRGRSHGP